MKKSTVWIAALLMAFAHTARAAEVEGVRVEENITLPGGPALVLNGAGVRNKLLFIELYVGALYLTAKKTNPDEVLKDPGAKRVMMHVLASDLTARDLSASLNSALAANHIPAELALIEGRIRELNRMMSSVGTLKKGAVVLLDYTPANGTRITINGEEKIVIKGEDFFQAMLRIWIGNKPVDGRLRDSMLGGKGEFRLF